MKAILKSKYINLPQSAVTERHSLICLDNEGTEIPAGFVEQMDLILDAVRDLLAHEKICFCRFFLSDAANQEPLLSESISTLGLGAVSILQQPPLDGTKIAAWVYSIQGELNPAYSHLWAGGITASEGASAKAQMLGIFKKYEAFLDGSGLSVKADCIRTWIFAQNVDVNYGGVVEGRKEYFDSIGLTSKTHYIASTGIEGRHANPETLVQMDAYAVGGLQPGQIKHLQARTHLNPTYEYGVTFERGTAVTYGDRRHVFISGTASIDNKGNILHIGDISLQTGRMLENVQMLLAEAGAGFGDVAQAIVYLRDQADAATVRAMFRKRLPQLNAVFVQAPVCRPQWLIEMECMAVTSSGDSSFEKF